MIRGIKRPKLKKITVLAAFALWQDRGSVVKVLLEFGLSGHAARDCRLGWCQCRDGSDGAILLLRLLLRVCYVEKPETIVLWGHWFGHSLRPGKLSDAAVELTPLVAEQLGAEGAISHKVVSSRTPPLLLINKARSLSFSNPIHVATASMEHIYDRLCWHYATFRSTFVYDAIGQPYPLSDITQLSRAKIPYPEG